MAGATGAHALHIHHGNAEFVGAISRFLGPPLREGAAAILILSQHRRNLIAQWADAQGLAPERIRYIDSESMLEAISEQGRPDGQMMAQSIQNLRAAAGFVGNGAAVAMGDMVNILWQDGKPDQALELEHMWHDLIGPLELPLLCIYDAITQLQESDLMMRVHMLHTPIAE